ncbi:amidohydrolase family protein [Pseudarthrobacter sp. PvP004]|uniref:amidohydrolase family protein n=1 Tax=Pseudarthrobacter sp. PvP004 TaxID=2817850 RepID=UPI001AEA2835|nr:amidohydrolase family protein [Pseudarthrobacter sp. PvP004]
MHYLSHHVFERKALTFAEAIHKMTVSVAEHFDIKGRGFIRPGFYADIAVFDPEILRATDTFTMPETYAQAARWVAVNGELVVDNGGHAHQLPGRFLPRAS